ncbi:MAG: DUF4258 domain-containing protein [Dehalococcoidia bacterium]
MAIEEAPFTSAVISSHAQEEMARRGISDRDVRRVLDEPGTWEAVRPGRVVLTALGIDAISGKDQVLRVFVDIDREPPVVVTAYRSSKIRKYWSAR